MYEQIYLIHKKNGGNNNETKGFSNSVKRQIQYNYITRSKLKLKPKPDND